MNSQKTIDLVTSPLDARAGSTAAVLGSQGSPAHACGAAAIFRVCAETKNPKTLPGHPPLMTSLVARLEEMGPAPGKSMRTLKWLRNWIVKPAALAKLFRVQARSSASRLAEVADRELTR
jgi:hypothetical protein